MATKKIKDSEIRQIMAEVERDIDEVMALHKARPGEETSAEPPPDTSATSAPPDTSGGPPPESAPPVDAAPPPPPAASAPPEMPPAAGDAPPDPAAGDEPSAPPDPVALQAEFAKLPLEELKVYYLAAKNALIAASGAGAESAPPVDAAPPPPAAGPPPDSAPPAEKSQDFGDVKALLAKFTAFVTSSEKRFEKSEESLAALADVVGRVVGAPKRLAVTRISQITPPVTSPVASLSKSEIKVRLDRRVVDPKLTKSDRALIDSYDIGKVGVTEIAHLIA